MRALRTAGTAVAVAAALLLAAGGAAAQPAPGAAGPAAAGTVPPPSPGPCTVPAAPRGQPVPEAALEAMLARLPQCQDDVAWLVAAGQRLNQSRRHGDAADLIERALLLDPSLKGARVDYVVALAGSGDVDSARALLRDLLADPDLPGGLRGALLRRDAGLPLALAGGWRVDGSVGVRLGRDSNLLGAPDLDSITLTLGGQLVEVLLDDSYRARRGQFRQAEASLGLTYAGARGLRWVLGGAVRDRSSSQLPAARSRQAEALTEASLPLLRSNALRLFGSASAGRLRSGLSAFDSETQAAGLEAALGRDCGLRLGAESQRRAYRDNPVLSGRYSGQTAALVCGFGPAGLPGGGFALMSLRSGTDVASDPTRPGGEQRQRALRLAASQPLSRLWAVLPGHLTADMEWSRQQDASFYSFIIDSGRTRQTLRRSGRLEWRLPLSGPGGTTLEPAIGIDWVSQSSNIALFRLDSRSPYVALRGRF
jgi:hypothetical protein